MERIQSSMARPRPGDRPSLLLCPLPATPLASLSPVRTPDAPLATDMDPPGLERKLRIRALRFSWIKDAIQALAFTAAGIWAISTFWYREKYLPEVSDTDVTVRIVAEALGERDGVVTVRARTVLENPGHVPARVLARSVVARGQRPGPAPPKSPKPPPIGAGLPFGEFIVEDRTLEARSELLYQALVVSEPFDGKRNFTVRPGGHLEDETILFVRREEYSLLNVELQLAWLPAAFPLRKECYTLVRDGDGVVSVGLPAEATRCRLSTVSAATGINLLELRGAAPTR